MRKLSLLSALAFFLLLLGCSKEEIGVEASNKTTTVSKSIADKINATATLIEELDRSIEQETFAFKSRGPTVVLTEDAGFTFAEAIAMASPNGKVIVRTGDYFESETVTINQRVNIQGESGAVLHVAVSGPSLALDPAIHVLGADEVRIAGLDIRPQQAPGNAGIVVENSSQVRIKNNRITDFGVGVWLYEADQARVLGNFLRGVDGNIWGLVAQRGQGVVIRDNEVSEYSLGIFMSDFAGRTYRNEAHHNAGTGIFLCTAQFNILPGGNLPDLPDPANSWIVTQNYAHHNGTGYEAMDGAFENLIVQNASADNDLYDIALRGEIDSDLLFPTSRDNIAISVGRYQNLIIKHCGENNTVIGGNIVDPAVDPCP